MIWDVIVVGAGPSGLSCARKLADAHDGGTERGPLRVCVLDSRDRVGGRCFGDMGAGYVDQRQRRVARVVESVGLELYDVWDKGTNVLQVTGKRRQFKGTDPSGLTLRTLLALGRIVASLEVNSRSPFSSCADSGAGILEWTDLLCDLDSVTLGDYIASRTKDKEAIETVRVAVLPVFGAPPEKINLLWFLFYCHSNGTLSRLLSVGNGAQHKKITGGGFEEMCKRLASGSVTQGGSSSARRALDIKLGFKVSSITKGDGLITITSSAGEVLSAHHCVLAIQPQLYSKVNFSPDLPACKQEFGDAMARGGSHYAKVRLAFPEPFWRKLGMSGQLASDLGPATYWIDDVKPCDCEHKFGLVAFIVGTQHDAKWRTLEGGQEARKWALIKQLAEAFLMASAAMPVPTSYVEYDWTLDPHSSTCVPVLPASAGPQAWEGLGMLKCWDGHLWFAGTESALVSNGYVDGALWSGERAAHGILSSLGLKSTFSQHEPLAAGKTREKANSRGAVEHFFLGRALNRSRLRSLKLALRSDKADES